ncbi:MAG TPA: hypothetical protein VM934_02235 [Pyrinomonadaceae bacterium]|jgi:hypothetical protein|nr:hypothetical protein [Pyrinomonadaceae bacterium]
MGEQAYRERECIHRSQGATGEYYKGITYVKCLQRLRSAAATRIAGKVTAFFWADAAQIMVWLCHDCAAEVGLLEGEGQRPHAFSQS